MPRFLEMEREHGSVIRALRKQNRSPTLRKGTSERGVAQGTSGARYSLFLSFDRGMQLLTDKLAERISNSKSQIANSKPETSTLKSEIQYLPSEISDLQSQISDSDSSDQTSIRLNTTVESLARAGVDSAGNNSKKWRIETDQNETIFADAVCLALPAYASARLLSSVDTRLASELEGISYASSATINLAYRREDIPHPLDGFGFVVPFIEKRTIMACTFSSVKFPGRAPQGHALLRAFVGGALQPQLFNLTPDQLVSTVRRDLRDLLGIDRVPLFAEVAKWEQSMPQYHLGHLARVKRIEERVASLPGLTLAGNAYSGLGIPDCIRSGQNAAEAIFSQFNTHLITWLGG
jgi:oxygen-dependent protoporphyrinogen oxidase